MRTIRPPGASTRLASASALDRDHADFTGCAHFQDMVAERIGVGSAPRVRE
jgi:hypothetical protein